MTDGTVNPQGDGQGQGGGAWTAQLKDDLKGNEFFNQFQTVSDFGKWGLETSGKLKDAEGKLNSAITIPGEKATDAERAAFYAKLGRPETPDKYELDPITGLPEGLTPDPEGEKWFKGLAHELGLTPAQAKRLHSEAIKRLVHDPIKAAEAARDKSREASITTLKKDWPGNTYDENTALVGRFMDKFATPEVRKIFDETGIGNNPVLVKWVHSLAKGLSEDKFVRSDGSAPKKTEPGQLRYPSMEAK